MKIIPIGVCGGYPEAGQASSCYLVDNGRARVVIDLGSGALSALQNFTGIDGVDAFILTHLHYDHFSDALALAYVPGNRVIYAPGGPAECFCLLKARDNFDVRVINNAVRFETGGMRFSFIRTDHSVECYAVRVEEGDNAMVYTSDTLWFDDLPAFCRDAKLVIADCSAAGGMSHMTPAEGGRLRALTGARVLAAHTLPGVDVSEEISKAGIEPVKAGKELTVW